MEKFSVENLRDMKWGRKEISARLYLPVGREGKEERTERGGETSRIDSQISGWGLDLNVIGQSWLLCFWFFSRSFLKDWCGWGNSTRIDSVSVEEKDGNWPKWLDKVGRNTKDFPLGQHSVLLSDAVCKFASFAPKSVFSVTQRILFLIDFLLLLESILVPHPPPTCSPRKRLDIEDVTDPMSCEEKQPYLLMGEAHLCNMWCHFSWK